MNKSDDVPFNPKTQNAETQETKEDAEKSSDAQDNFQRIKPRDALEIEYQISGQKPSTSNPEVSGNKRAVKLGRDTPDLGLATEDQSPKAAEFVAPRRAITRKHRHKIKAPLNFLAMQDYKGDRNNLNINLINPDLHLSNRSNKNDCETVKLSQSTKTPDQRRAHFFQLQDSRLGGRMPNLRLPSPQKGFANEGRKLTPIKIVDLSARPTSKETVSIKKEYTRHFPLLQRSKQQPLKQDLVSMITDKAKVGNIDNSLERSNTKSNNSKMMNTSFGASMDRTRRFASTTVEST